MLQALKSVQENVAETHPPASLTLGCTSDVEACEEQNSPVQHLNLKPGGQDIAEGF